MKSKWVMAASAVFMGVIGLAGTFVPDEILARVHVTEPRVLVLLIQLTGALYIAFAMLNWMMKESVIGGIYNRPLAMANLLHFFAGGLALLKGVRSAGADQTAVIVAAVLYLLFAIAFGRIVFTSPVK
jgi:hypothetical protein